MRVMKINEDALKAFQDEVTIMAPLRHNNLVALVGACWKDGPDRLALIMEYATLFSSIVALRHFIIWWLSCSFWKNFTKI